MEKRHVATNLAVDDGLIPEAQRIGGYRRKKAAITEALKKYIRRRQQLQVTITIRRGEIYDECSRRHLCMVSCVQTGSRFFPG
jgi:hypothetical protein